MRPALTLILVTSLLTSIFFYTQFLQRLRGQRTVVVETPAENRYSLSIKATFDAAADEFGGPAVQVLFRDQTLFESSEPVPAGKEIRVEDISGVKQGLNDFFVMLSPVAAEDADGSNSIFAPKSFVVEIFRDRESIQRQLFWSEDASAVSGLLRLVVEGNDDGANDVDSKDDGGDHDH